MMIQVNEIRDVLKRLERLMYGHNFEVTFGMEIFEACDNYINFIDRLKILYPDASPENQTPIPHDFNSVIEAIQICFDYRGDNGAGLVLTEKRNQQVLIEQQKYLNFISAFSAGAVNAFSYPDETGIPGYRVWWDYKFILFNEKNRCLFIYGAASD
jgi:hypothetical protein